MLVEAHETVFEVYAKLADDTNAPVSRLKQIFLELGCCVADEMSCPFLIMHDKSPNESEQMRNFVAASMGRNLMDDDWHLICPSPPTQEFLKKWSSAYDQFKVKKIFLTTSSSFGYPFYI